MFGTDKEDEISIIRRSDLNVYKVLDGRFKAYVRGRTGLQGYGVDEEDAIQALALIFSVGRIPFDFAEEER